MVIDFSVVKEELEKQISHLCDHGLIVDADDETMTKMLRVSNGDVQWVKEHRSGKSVSNVAGFKVYLVPFPPTCEHLARHWYAIMSDALKTRTHGQVHVKKIRVYETPNSYADFPSGDLRLDK